MNYFKINLFINNVFKTPQPSSCHASIISNPIDPHCIVLRGKPPIKVHYYMERNVAVPLAKYLPHSFGLDLAKHQNISLCHLSPMDNTKPELWVSRFRSDPTNMRQTLQCIIAGAVHFQSFQMKCQIWDFLLRGYEILHIPTAKTQELFPPQSRDLNHTVASEN